MTFAVQTFSRSRRLALHNSRLAKAVTIIVPVFCLTIGVHVSSTLAGSPPPPIVPQVKRGAPLPGLTPEQLSRFHIGAAHYDHTLTDVEGLGPIFNKQSCSNCHNNPFGGAGSQDVTRFGLATKEGFDPMEKQGGSLLQQLAISEDCAEVLPDDPDLVTQQRVTNGSLGYGLIESIPDAAILAVRDAQPLNQRGMAHIVSPVAPVPCGPRVVGRFGWKAQVSTILTFSADASLMEMGLTNRFFGQENAPNGDHVRLAECDLVPDPEDGPDEEGFDFIDRVTDFQRFISGPPQTPRAGMSGEAKFNQIGCNVCHTSSFTTHDCKDLEGVLRNQTIRPYSDFLLHYMGQFGDPIVQGEAYEQWVRTPVLWGLYKRDPMWHDGSIAASGKNAFAVQVNNAILRHDDGVGLSQGRFAAIAYAGLSQDDKNNLIAFLQSLGRIEFDADMNEVINVVDFQSLSPCAAGAGGPYDADHPCAIHDIDQDGFVNAADFESFLLVYQGPRRDCNQNGVVDLLDIINGAADANNNGIPDSCEPTCNADIVGGGVVNVDDLLALLQGWGPCPPPGPLPCAADLNLDSLVNVDDLLQLLAGWGQCQ